MSKSQYQRLTLGHLWPSGQMQRYMPCCSAPAVYYIHWWVCTQWYCLLSLWDSSEPLTTKARCCRNWTHEHTWNSTQASELHRCGSRWGRWSSPRSAHSRAGAHTGVHECRCQTACLPREELRSTEMTELTGAVHPQALSEHNYNANWWDFWKNILPPHLFRSDLIPSKKQLSFLLFSLSPPSPACKCKLCKLQMLGNLSIM